MHFQTAVVNKFGAHWAVCLAYSFRISTIALGLQGVHIDPEGNSHWCFIMFYRYSCSKNWPNQYSYVSNLMPARLMLITPPRVPSSFLRSYLGWHPQGRGLGSIKIEGARFAGVRNPLGWH